MNAGTRLQKEWRWNRKPLRVKITRKPDWVRFDYLSMREVRSESWSVAWLRWDFRRAEWREWREYCGSGPLASVIGHYRDYANDWRGRGDA